MIEVQLRNRVHPLPDATATPLASNAWEIRVPRTEAALKLLGPGLSKLDGAALVVDGQWTEPALISREDGQAVWVSAWAL